MRLAERIMSSQNQKKEDIIRARFFVEISWILRSLENEGFLENLGYKQLSKSDKEKIWDIYASFDSATIEKVEELQKITKNDIKAGELFIDQALASLGLGFLVSLVHSTYSNCTSEYIEENAKAILRGETYELAC